VFCRKFFYGFFFFATLNVFGMRNSDKSINESTYCFEFRLDQEVRSIPRVSDIFKHLLASCNFKTISPTAPQASFSRTSSLSAAQKKALLRSISLKLQEFKRFPEILSLLDYYCEKSDNSEFLDAFRKSYAARYVLMLLENEKALTFFEILKIEDPERKTCALEKSLRSMQDYIKRCKGSIAHNQFVYNSTGRAHVRKKTKRLSLICSQEKKLAKTRAEVFIIQRILAREKEAAVKRKNRKNLQQTAQECKVIARENSGKEFVPEDDKIHQKVLNNQKAIARKVFDQELSEQQKDYIYDVADMDAGFLKEFGITEKELDNLLEASELNDYVHKRGIYYLKGYEIVWRKCGSNQNFKPLIGKGIDCAKKGIECKKQNDVAKVNNFFRVSQKILGFLKTTVDTLGKIGQAAIDSVEPFVGGTMEGTDEFVQTVGEICEGPESAVYTGKSLLGKIMQAADNSFGILIKAITNPAEAKKGIQAWQDSFDTFLKMLESREGRADIARAVGKITSKTILTLGSLKALGNLFRCGLAVAYQEITGKIWPAGIGSTGRTVATSLEEHLAMQEVMSKPHLGDVLERVSMTDQRWHRFLGWKKMQQIIENVNQKGDSINIHYVYNKFLNICDDFKFKS